VTFLLYWWKKTSGATFVSFQAQTGTLEEPLTHHKLAGKLSHVTEFKDTGKAPTNSGERQVV
jgi:hypothetical protein